MPYSQLHQRPKERLESTQMKMTSCLDDLASVPDNEFVELVWENGQVLMQGQSNKTRKTSPAFTSHVYKTQGRNDEDAVTPKLERFGTRDSAWNDLSSSGPSGHLGMSQDDELARWLNYPLDDYSEFFSDLSGVNQNTHSVQNNAGLVDKNNSYVQVVRDSRRASIYGGVNSDEGNASKITGEGPDLTKTRVSKLYLPPSQQCQTSFPSHRSRVSDFTGCSALRANCDDSNQKFASTSGVPDTKVQKQGSEPTRMHQQPSNNTGFMNFSHFLRPAALIKSNQKSIGATASPDVSSTNMLRSSNKVSVVSSSNPIESTVIDSTSVSRSIMGSHSRTISLPGKVDVKSSMNKPPKEPGAISQEGASRKSRSPDQVPGQASSFAASAAIGRPDNEKGVELVVTSSSVCSGNSTGGTSNDPNNVLKRKSRDAEESEYPSEDVEEESVGARKPATARGGTGTKRSRAAEVHNLSERRRRDRINEKMRALQELIPNCNKVDKASMLDEAIEYLKTLQLQLQIMSMGTGMYMSPMMLPPGMQHMHASNIAHFSPMSVGMGMGMGMGMGFGMGMLNVSGGSPGCPLIQVPPMHGAHFPCPPVSGSSNLPPMAGSNHPMFGLPGQGLPMPVPPAPFGPLSAGPAANPALLPVVSGVATSVDVPNSIAPSCTKDPIENINSQMLKTDAEYSRNQMPIQGQTTKEGLEQPAALQRNDQNPRSTGNGAINPNL